MHFTDVLEEQSHSFPLASTLTPVVNFQNVQRLLYKNILFLAILKLNYGFFLRTYLGFPYTRCIETKATNNYTYDEQGRQIYDIGENPYKESLCIFQALMEVENLPIFKFLFLRLFKFLFLEN